MNEPTWRSKVAAPLAMLLALLVGWEIASASGSVQAYLLPPPFAVIRRIADNLPLLLAHTTTTAFEILLGFAAAVLFGVIIAATMVYVPAFGAAIAPWLVTSQVIPKVALGPLFMIWLGFGLLPKVIIAFLVAFFPVLLNTIVGLTSVERDAVFLLRSMGAGRWGVFRYLLLPTALPNVFAGMKVAVTLATVGAIVGEFIGANEGLGFLLLFANGTMDTTLVFSAVLLLSVLALVLYGVVCMAESVFIRWHVSQRADANAGTM